MLNAYILRRLEAQLEAAKVALDNATALLIQLKKEDKEENKTAQ